MKQVIEFLTNEAGLIQNEIVAEKQKAMQYYQTYQPGQAPRSDEVLMKYSMHLGTISLLLQKARKIEQEQINANKKPVKEKKPKPLSTIKPKNIKVKK